MKVIILSPNDYRRQNAEAFVERLGQLQVAAVIIDADSREGTSMRELYDLMSVPALALIQDSGALVEKWEHDYPLPEEISYLYHV